jgi:DNA mismatch endonuclease (patch repair protein)
MPKKPLNRTEEEKRSYTMSRIRSKNTSIELLLQKALWHAGVRYRKNYSKVPGHPDIAITKHKVAVFCDGEFWHGKDWGEKRDKFKSNSDYWIQKIERNMARDKKCSAELEALGWTVVRFWGDEINKELPACVDKVLAILHQIQDGQERDYPAIIYANFAKPQIALQVAEDETGEYTVDQ